MGMGFQFEQHRLGLWDLSWDLKKTIFWEMGLGLNRLNSHENRASNPRNLKTRAVSFSADEEHCVNEVFLKRCYDTNFSEAVWTANI